MWCDVEDEHSYTLALTLPPQGSSVTWTSTRTGCPSAQAPAMLCSVPMASSTGDSYISGAKPPAHCAYVPTEGGGRGGSRREGNAKAKSLIDKCVVTDVNDCTYQACCWAIATSAVRLPDTGTYGPQAGNQRRITVGCFPGSNITWPVICQVPAVRTSGQLEAAWDCEVGVPPGMRTDSKTGCSSHTGLATRKQRVGAHARAPLRSAVRPGTREGVRRKG